MGSRLWKSWSAMVCSVTLIIADVVMPQISGRELAERVLAPPGNFLLLILRIAGVASVAKTIRNLVANDANSTLPGSSLGRSSTSERVSG